MGADQIAKYFKYLNTKDQALAQKFLDKRDFQSLKYLVDSALVIAIKQSRKKSIDDYYKSDQVDGIDKLKTELYDYILKYQILDDEDFNNYDNL